MRKKPRPHSSLDSRCKLFLKLDGVGSPMMSSLLPGKGLTPKSFVPGLDRGPKWLCWPAWRSQTALKGKRARQRWMAGCGGAARQEISKLSNTDSQSEQICAKWYWLRIVKGGNCHIVPLSALRGSNSVFPSPLLSVLDTSKWRLHFALSNIHVNTTNLQKSCASSLEFSLNFKMQKRVFSQSRNILPSPEFRKSCYTTLRRWMSAWPLGSRFSRRHIGQKHFKENQCVEFCGVT